MVSLDDVITVVGMDHFTCSNFTNQASFCVLGKFLNSQPSVIIVSWINFFIQYTPISWASPTSSHG